MVPYPEPRIELIPAKTLIGKRLLMSFADNRTGELWRSFMPRRNEIKNCIGQALYSLQCYPPSFFYPVNENTGFEKWAAREVTHVQDIPSGMEVLQVPEGQYAVFLYRGDARKAAPFYSYIFGTWLPGSGYQLDNRPHFEILGEKYKRDDPTSEEEVWIPIRSGN
jgi:AraC family transcriptional regulator